MLYYNRLQVYHYCTCVKEGCGGVAVYRDGIAVYRDGIAVYRNG